MLNSGTQLALGTVLAQRYTLQTHLGQGGMGSVYFAHDNLLDQTIALKILHPEFRQDEKSLQRFLREVQLTRLVTHLNVVRTYECGRDGDRIFFTMEYIPGTSLKEKLNDGPMSCIEVQQILFQIARGLSAIHAQGIIHRDLKPSNIMITKENVVKITDLGIARPKISELTTTNEIVGSAPYLAPEIWSQNEISFLSDIYAFGVLAYETLTGQQPFEAETPAQMVYAHLTQELIAPIEFRREIPSWLSDLVMAMLARERSDRLQSAADVMQELQNKCEKIDALLPAVASEQEILPPALASADYDVSSKAQSAKTRKIVPIRNPNGSRQLVINLSSMADMRLLRKKMQRPLIWTINILLAIYLVYYYSDSIHDKLFPLPVYPPKELLALSADDLSLSDTAPLDSWPSKVTSETTVLQPNEERRPKFKRNVINGHGVVMFDGKDDVLNCQGLAQALTLANEISVFYVVRAHQTQSNSTVWALQTDSFNSIARSGFMSGNSAALRVGSMGLDGNPAFRSQEIAIMEFAIYSYVLDKKEISFFRNGRLLIHGNVNKLPRFSASNLFNIGADFDPQGPLDYFAGDMAAFKLISGHLEDKERVQLEEELAAYYGIKMQR